MVKHTHQYGLGGSGSLSQPVTDSKERVAYGLAQRLVIHPKKFSDEQLMRHRGLGYAGIGKLDGKHLVASGLAWFNPAKK